MDYCYVNIDSIKSNNNNQFTDVKYICDKNQYIYDFEYERKKIKNKIYKYYFFNDKLIFNRENFIFSKKILSSISKLDLSKNKDLTLLCTIIRYIKKNKYNLFIKNYDMALQKSLYWESLIKDMIEKSNISEDEKLNLSILFHFIKNEKTNEILLSNEMISYVDMINNIIDDN